MGNTEYMGHLRCKIITHFRSLLNYILYIVAIIIQHTKSAEIDRTEVPPTARDIDNGSVRAFNSILLNAHTFRYRPKIKRPNRFELLRRMIRKKRQRKGYSISRLSTSGQRRKSRNLFSDSSSGIVVCFFSGQVGGCMLATKIN